MPKVTLTHRGIAGLRAGKWLTDYWDQSLPNFGVRVHHSGRKAFFVRYYSDEGKKRRLTLGTYPTMSLADARTQAKEAIGRLARGEDPQAQKAAEKAAETFADLASAYLEKHARVKKRTWREDERILRVYLLPAWRRKKAKDSLYSADDQSVLRSERLQALVEAVPESLFERFYGLDHRGLSDGSAALLPDDGEVGRALFGAGLGVSNLGAVLEGLEREAAGLRKKLDSRK